MQFYAPLICSLLLMISFALPVAAKPTKTTKTADQRINELSHRLSAFESNWNRFRIGGDLTVKSNTFFNDTEQNLNELNFDQELNLNLDAFLDRNLSVSMKLTHFGNWGDKFTDPSNGARQMDTPLQLDEAFLRMEYPTALNYLGRFRFSLSPLGLISDFYSSPVEGFSFQKVYNQYHAIALYSRINNKFTFQTDENTTQVVESGNYWVFRLGWANSGHIIGLNLLPNGITGEKGLSLDWS
ncbi:MAG TPA: hypothetical protein VEC37_12455, partial [Bacillota bacterium]|nr:hypothetical protein [Bacillota bacterium]